MNWKVWGMISFVVFLMVLLFYTYREDHIYRQTLSNGTELVLNKNEVFIENENNIYGFNLSIEGCDKFLNFARKYPFNMPGGLKDRCINNAEP